MNTFTLNTIFRPHILDLPVYSSARDEYTGREGVFLDANENAIGSTFDARRFDYADRPLQPVPRSLSVGHQGKTGPDQGRPADADPARKQYLAKP